VSQSSYPKKQSGVNSYLKTQIMTASGEQLMLMLYDGCLRFMEQAKIKIEEKDLHDSHEMLTKAKRIILELLTTLDYNVDKELCENLSGIYNYCYRLLLAANLNQDIEPVDEVIGLLKPLRDTWLTAIEKARAENQGAPICATERSSEIA
jgi:flagellar protein FliS